MSLLASRTLTLSHMPYSRLSNTETSQSTISNLMKMALSWVENTVGTGEIACYEQFLLFQHCFQTTCTAET